MKVHGRDGIRDGIRVALVCVMVGTVDKQE